MEKLKRVKKNVLGGDLVGEFHNGSQDSDSLLVPRKGVGHPPPNSATLPVRA